MLDDAAQLNAIVEGHAGLEGRELVSAVIRNAKGRVALLSSFGAESSVLLHMVSEIQPDLPVLFLDTLKLFPDTIAYREQLARELGLTNVQNIVPDTDDLIRVDANGILHQQDKDACCHVRKTLPMQRAFADYDVIISGRKRFHGATRENLEFISVQGGKIKVEPLASYTALDLHNYMQVHHLPSHPLKLQGYHSIGCEPCTIVGGTDNDPRAGRWAGTEKTECGIHFSASGKLIRTDLRSETRQAAGV